MHPFLFCPANDSWLDNNMLNVRNPPRNPDFLLKMNLQPDEKKFHARHRQTKQEIIMLQTKNDRDFFFARFGVKEHCHSEKYF